MCFEIGSENYAFIFDRTKLPNSFNEKILDAIIDNDLNLIPILGGCVKKQRKTW